MRAEVQIQPYLQRGATQTQQHRQRGMVQTQRRQQETVQAQRLRMREMQHKAAVQGIPLLQLRRHRNRPIRIMQLRMRKCPPIPITIMKVITVIPATAIMTDAVQ